ncbi:hypothetical protein CGLO_11837 [Colletotrichum gloeosporioides Cg-14]|uniref:Uncharacterized protein n=1 Tax=Colletotrichum gloeosporioides (strain Cg-14) TaxID=1237896 RepID=T0K7D5_COLGC|nr:hypothetical protein CGLO_11837 [Colletotrichum gloeosporioides Cg-14]
MSKLAVLTVDELMREFV